jgi:AraC family transcriptional regulator of arabinose operon
MDRRIREIVVLMEEDLQWHFSLNHLSCLVNLSPSRLSHLFKSETGLTPNCYLRRLRIFKAEELLRTTFLSVKEIRIKVAGGDRSHFSRQFKKENGLTPTEFRRRENSQPQKRPLNPTAGSAPQ